MPRWISAIVVPSFGAVLNMRLVAAMRRRRHVLHDDRGIAGNVLAEMARGHARLQVVAAADAGADDEGDLLAGVEILLGRGWRDRRRQRGGREQSDAACRPETAMDNTEHSQNLPSFKRRRQMPDFRAGPKGGN